MEFHVFWMWFVGTGLTFVELFRHTFGFGPIMTVLSWLAVLVWPVSVPLYIAGYMLVYVIDKLLQE